MGLGYFLPKPTKKLSPQNEEKIMLLNGQKCICALAHGQFIQLIFFCFLVAFVAATSSFFLFFFLFLPRMLPFFFPWAVGVLVVFFFFFFLLDMIFFFGHDFFLINWVFFFFFFCGCLSLFCFNWLLWGPIVYKVLLKLYGQGL